MDTKLITPHELDRQLRYPRGRSARLARKGLIPCIRLPDGELRFEPTSIEQWIQEQMKRATVKL